MRLFGSVMGGLYVAPFGKFRYGRYCNMLSNEGKWREGVGLSYDDATIRKAKNETGMNL